MPEWSRLRAYLESKATVIEGEFVLGIRQKPEASSTFDVRRGCLTLLIRPDQTPLALVGELMDRLHQLLRVDRLRHMVLKPD